jgi:hypothetical protein
MAIKQVSLLGSIGRALIIVGETPLEFYGPYYSKAV